MTQSKKTLFGKILNSKERYSEENLIGLRYSKLLKAVLILSTLIFCSAFFSFHIDQNRIDTPDLTKQIGNVWNGPTMKADFSFPIYKSKDQYLSELQDSRQKTHNVFNYFPEIVNASMILIDNMIGELKTISQSGKFQNSDYFSEKSVKQFLSISQQQRDRELQLLDRELKKFMKNIYENGFIDISLEKSKQSEIIVRINPKDELILKKTFLTNKSQFAESAEKFLNNIYSQNLFPVLQEILQHLNKPDLIYSEELTEKARDLAEKSVPRTLGFVRKDATIIEKGEKVKIDHLLKLQSYEISSNLKSDNPLTILSFIGSLGHSGIIFFILFLYLFKIRKKIYLDNFQISVICTLIAVVSILSWLSLEIPSELPLEYLVFLPAFSMLAAIVFDSRTAFYITVTMSLYLGGIRGNDYVTAVSMMFAGALAAYTVRDIKNRTQMFKSIFYIFIGLLIPIVAFGLVHSMDYLIMLRRIMLAAVNASVSPLITFGLLFLLERFSNIATDLRLQEYNNLNHPLLIKMSEAAPGTYQHTLAVAILAERCAGEIGANQLLTKVGAYFHDIGKISKAEYFAENQLNFDSKHDLLPPRKSAQAIREHVSAGIELARQYKLPHRIIDFIPMHHGSTLIKHFYVKAIEESKTGAVNEEDFRYPGPKPNTREAAILMICDSAEALSRLDFKDNSELELAIDKNIKDRLNDGQFDECPITLQELQIIKETCLKSLIGIRHQRVKYKELPIVEEQESDNGTFE